MHCMCIAHAIRTLEGIVGLFDFMYPDQWNPVSIHLVSHYSAIGDTISCDAPYSAIGFRGKLLLRYHTSKACLCTAIGHF